MATSAAGPFLRGMAPVWICLLSFVPSAYLSLLSTLETMWPLESSVSLVASLRFLGALSLVVGHALSCRRKPRLSRSDVCYLTGATLLSLTFGGVCASAATGLAYLAPPPSTVSAAGCSLLVCFLDLVRVALKPGVSAITRAALFSAITGSSSLVVAGVSASHRLRAATLASSCFLVANSSLLFLLARARTPAPTALAQASKVQGSLLLLSANVVAFGWPKQATLASVSGVLSEHLTTALFLKPNLATSFLASLVAAAYYAAYSL